jgi:hypothetical protein
MTAPDCGSSEWLSKCAVTGGAHRIASGHFKQTGRVHDILRPSTPGLEAALLRCVSRRSSQLRVRERQRQVCENAYGWEPQRQDGANGRRDYAIAAVCTVTPTQLRRVIPG